MLDVLGVGVAGGREPDTFTQLLSPSLFKRMICKKCSENSFRPQKINQLTDLLLSAVDVMLALLDRCDAEAVDVLYCCVFDCRVVLYSRLCNALLSVLFPP